MLAEYIPEETRKRFKSKVENTGKIDDTGAWGIVRHPNFAGYVSFFLSSHIHT
jgi:steroid 5-alpha reductase family enzyme